jgi:aminoglycoside phosphotransferase (APT) family kinase protein
MAVLRRTGRQRDQDGATPDPGADLDTGAHDVARAVIAAAGAALGHAVELVAAPEPIFAGHGPGAHRVRLDCGHGAWSGPLVARAAPPGVLRREAAWIAEVRSLGFPAPDLLADGSGGVLVVREPPGANLAERMISDMAALPRLLADFGRLHAALHALPAPDLDFGDGDGDGDGEVDGTVGDLGTFDDVVQKGRQSPGGAFGRIATQVDWLTEHRPPPDRPVVCHGELNPVHVVIDGDGDGAVAVPVNWTGAGLGDAAYDVAATLVGFWSTPLYVDSAVQRRVLRMVRDSLASAYLAAYREAADRPLDGARLDFWQAYHLSRVAAGIARCADRGPAGPWDTAAHVAQPASTLAEIGRRFRELAGA